MSQDPQGTQKAGCKDRFPDQKDAHHAKAARQPRPSAYRLSSHLRSGHKLARGATVLLCPEPSPRFISSTRKVTGPEPHELGACPQQSPCPTKGATHYGTTFRAIKRLEESHHTIGFASHRHSGSIFSEVSFFQCTSCCRNAVYRAWLLPIVYIGAFNPARFLEYIYPYDANTTYRLSVLPIRLYSQTSDAGGF